MINPIEILVSAIATQEGAFSPLSLPVLRNNPGDLRYAGQPHASSPAWNKGGAVPIAIFSGDQYGSAWQYGVLALYRDILAKAAQGSTVRQIIAVFAPPSENDTAQYIANVLEWTGLPADVPLVQLLPPLVQLNKPMETRP